MGVTASTAEFLIEARVSGVSFGRTATIGRQGLAVGPTRLWRMLGRYGCRPAAMDRRTFYGRFRDEPWVDPLLETLGADSVTSIDASDYEGANMVHDLNRPIPDELEARFDVVVDAGSLEHIFNVPVALESYMRMVKPDGRVILVTPANNYFGHGFYQFSPELFFRCFSTENGFVVERMLAREHDSELSRPIGGIAFPFESSGPRYEVADPAAVGCRVELQNRRPVTLFVQARRERESAPFVHPPQQSDYVATWEETNRAPREERAPVETDGSVLRRTLARSLSPETKLRFHLDLAPALLPLLDPFRSRRVARRRSFRNRRFFRRSPG